MNEKNYFNHVKKHYVVSSFLWFTTLFYAQTSPIRGTVVDEATKMALPGVNVVVKQSKVGVATDFDGTFVIDALPQDILVFSYLGFQTLEVPINNRTAIQVALLEDAQTLQEVVVVGFGTQQQKDITGAVAVIKSDVFENRTNNQVSDLIQGQAAGVEVVSNSGKPSTGFNVRIRGINSISASSDPLYVVDGVPTMDTRSINPADIETISVLKDAASAAIYGSQGANGVVIITTKQGKTEKTQINYDTYVGFAQVWRKLSVLDHNQYRELMTEMGRSTDWSRYTANTHWQDLVFRTAFSTNHQLSFSGKSNKTTYFVSGGFLKQEGVVLTSQVERKNFKINFSQEATPWFKVGTHVAYMDYADVDIPDNQTVNQGGVILGVLTTPQNIGIYNPDGTFTSNPFQDWENPMAFIYGINRLYKNQRLLGNVFSEIKFTEALKYKTNLGIDYTNATNNYFLDPFLTSYGRANKGIAKYETWLTNYYVLDNMITYDRIIDRHKIEALVGSVLQKTRSENSYVERRNFASNEIQTPNVGVLQDAWADKYEKANAAFIARLNYDFDGKYLVTANFRADGSSNFGLSNRWGYFPSFSAGWRISQEDFMSTAVAISDLKVRTGWGITGNDDIGRYAYFGRVQGNQNYPIGGIVFPGTNASSVPNSDLKWEQSTQVNIGVDVALWASRLSLSVDAYSKNTNDLLLDAPIPRTTGFDTAIQNVGALRNTGIEFQLRSKNWTTSHFTWDTDFNISFNKNKVIRMVGDTIRAGTVSGRGEVSLVTEGQPLGAFYGYKWAGVDPETGMAQYFDKNGQKTFAPKDSDRGIIGDANPMFIYGITNTLLYKDFGLTIFFQGSHGNDVFNATRIETEGMIDAKNQSAAVLDRWKNPGDQTQIPKAVANSTDNSRISDRFVENGSYLRLKAITLSYHVPKEVLAKMSIHQLRFYVTGENLFTITKYSGFDPEVNAFASNNNSDPNSATLNNAARGVDFGTYPQVRNILFGLSLSL